MYFYPFSRSHVVVTLELFGKVVTVGITAAFCGAFYIVTLLKKLYRLAHTHTVAVTLGGYIHFILEKMTETVGRKVQFGGDFRIAHTPVVTVDELYRLIDHHIFSRRTLHIEKLFRNTQ